MHSPLIHIDLTPRTRLPDRTWLRKPRVNAPFTGHYIQRGAVGTDRQYRLARGSGRSAGNLPPEGGRPLRRVDYLSRTMYVTYISDMPAISDPRAPASHPHAGRLGLVVTSCKERLVGVDVSRCSRRAIIFIHSRLSSFTSRRS